MSDIENETTNEAEEPEAKEAPDPGTNGVDDVDILKEVSQLGQHLGEALKEVWNSDERKKIEKEFVKGVQTASQEVRSLADGMRKGKATQDLKEGAEKVGQDVRTGILAGLRMLNRELSRVRKPERDEPKDDE